MAFALSLLMLDCAGVGRIMLAPAPPPTPLFPNIALVDDLLVGRAQPAAATIGRYLDERYPMFASVGRWLLRKKLAKVQRKYLSGHRNPRVFERYKNYRLTVCRVA